MSLVNIKEDCALIVQLLIELIEQSLANVRNQEKRSFFSTCGTIFLCQKKTCAVLEVPFLISVQIRRNIPISMILKNQLQIIVFAHDVTKDLTRTILRCTIMLELSDARAVWQFMSGHVLDYSPGTCYSMHSPNRTVIGCVE